MENPASNACGHLCGKVWTFSVKQEITTKMPHCGQILNQIVDICQETLKKRSCEATLVTILHFECL